MGLLSNFFLCNEDGELMAMIVTDELVEFEKITN
jgi:hypothetical protein